MAFSKAVREKIWIKTLLTGSSGSGKTVGSLLIASGLASKSGGRIAYIDTENGRSKYYADKFDFDVMIMSEPYTPEKYMSAIDDAISAGYKILVIDSLSHEWKYLNDVHDNMPGNSFANWGKLKPRHNKFMEKILQSPIHVIATARGKDAYVLEEKNGKQSPTKVGEGIVADKEVEYNYTCSLQIAQDTHVACAMKDNTDIFDGKYEVLTKEHGVALYNWANKGEEPVKPEKTPMAYEAASEIDTQDINSEVEDAVNTIAGLVNKLIELGISRKDISTAISKHHIVNGKGSANYKTITSVAVANNVMAELETLYKPV